MVFQPIKPIRLPEVIADQLRKLVLEGTLRPGTRLPTERELAERFGTSRPTVREAIACLEEEGLLRMQRGGMHVADAAAAAVVEPLSHLLMSDAQGVEDYMEFRQEVEGAAAHFAAMRATAVDRDALGRVVDRMLAAHSSSDPEADADFHLAIYEASHNVTILHVMRSLSLILRSYVQQNRRYLFDRQGYRETTLQQHQAIYEAIRSGAADEARALAQSHIYFAREAIAEARKSNERLELSIRRLSVRMRPAACCTDPAQD